MRYLDFELSENGVYWNRLCSFWAEDFRAEAIFRALMRTYGYPEQYRITIPCEDAPSGIIVLGVGKVEKGKVHSLMLLPPSG